ncbi:MULTISPECIES: hypothetical protein [Rhodoplanes]|nr:MULTISPECIES: hypothetical protein [Rhodoplanes]
MDDSKIAAVRRAKKRFAEVAPKDVDVVGLGIGLSGADPALKVNLRSRPADSSALPQTIDGVPVIYDVVGPIRPR